MRSNAEAHTHDDETCALGRPEYVCMHYMNTHVSRFAADWLAVGGCALSHRLVMTCNDHARAHVLQREHPLADWQRAGHQKRLAGAGAFLRITLEHARTMDGWEHRQHTLMKTTYMWNTYYYQITTEYLRPVEHCQFVWRALEVA
jgi:hypothetical protein